MFCFEEALTVINQFRRDNRNAIRNYYLSVDDLREVSLQKESRFIVDKHFIIILVNEEYFYRGYFFVDCIENLQLMKAAIDFLRVGTTIVLEYLSDLRGNEDINFITETLKKIGANLYSVQSRWRTKKIVKVLKQRRYGDNLIVAEEHHLDEVFCVLNSVFDPMISHLPTKDKLRELIISKCVYLAINDEGVVGVWICELRGKKSIYFYQNAVLKEYQGTGIGILLFHYALSKYMDFKDYSAWVEDSNIPSINMHKYVGMQPDGLKNYIFVIK